MAPTSTDLLLIACELAVQVQARPQRRDGTDAAVDASSGATLARRIRAGAEFSSSCNEDPLPSDAGPAPFHWLVTVHAGAARRTCYHLWLRESPSQLRALWASREQARAAREALPHAQRKKKPWGPL